MALSQSLHTVLRITITSLLSLSVTGFCIKKTTLKIQPSVRRRQSGYLRVPEILPCRSLQGLCAFYGVVNPYEPYGDLTMTYKYNPSGSNVFVRRHALNVHPRLTALRVDLRLPDVPAATDAAVISRFINALKARIDAYQKRKHREGKRVHSSTLHYARAGSSGS